MPQCSGVDRNCHSMPRTSLYKLAFRKTCTQGRNEGWKGGNISSGAESLQGAPKSPNNVTSTFFSTVHLLPKDLGLEHGGAKLASCPRRHLTSLRPCLYSCKFVLFNCRMFSCTLQSHVSIHFRMEYPFIKGSCSFGMANFYRKVHVSCNQWHWISNLPVQMCRLIMIGRLYKGQFKRRFMKFMSKVAVLVVFILAAVKTLSVFQIAPVDDFSNNIDDVMHVSERWTENNFQRKGKSMLDLNAFKNLFNFTFRWIFSWHQVFEFLPAKFMEHCNSQTVIQTNLRNFSQIPVLCKCMNHSGGVSVLGLGRETLPEIGVARSHRGRSPYIYNVPKYTNSKQTLVFVNVGTGFATQARKLRFYLEFTPSLVQKWQWNLSETRCFSWNGRKAPAAHFAPHLWFTLKGRALIYFIQIGCSHKVYLK